MWIPQRVTSLTKKSVCHLQRSLYCLKQAPRTWFETFRGRLGTIGFTQSPYDSSFSPSHAFPGVTVLLVYVDDIIITGTNDGMIKSLQASRQDSFHMKDLGPLLYFLGLEVHQSPTGLFINKHKYATDLIKLADLHDSSPVDTPLEVNF